MRGAGRRGAWFWACGLVVLWVACSQTQPPEDTDSRRAVSACEPMTCASQGMDCGIAIDGCGGTLHCGDCGPGAVCGGGGRHNVCGPAPCEPTTCAALGFDCGRVSDGCGDVLDCGACTPPESCGGGGTPNLCGEPACAPDTCESLARNCGAVPDGCGGILDCGVCADGLTCGAGGAPNVCGRGICKRATCDTLGKDCGPMSDGCGDMLDCGACAGGVTCGGGGVPNVCGHPPCISGTCEALGKDCGPVADGCGGMLDCGVCPGGQTCGGGGEPNVCGGGVCTPLTCESQGKNCGAVPDGCGGLLDCGGCPAGETCGGGGVDHVCGRPLCTPATCESLGKDCGTVPDGCGGALQCGACAQGETCGGGGTPNVCAAPSCHPYTCGLLGKDCGTVPDGCGGVLECGTCMAPESCGATGVPNVCAASASVCVDRNLGSILPVMLKGSTAHAGDDHQSSCGGSGAPDRGFLWTAPRSALFTFDTAKSAIRSLISVRGGCGGAELACAKDGISYGGGARVSVPLVQGQTVLVVVDSASPDRFNAGYFELHIDELRASEASSCFDGMDNDGDRWVDCADTDCHDAPGCGGRGCAHHDLGSALPVTFHGETAGSGDGFQGTCGALLQQDRAHLWTAPKAGTYVFDTAPSEWGNALYVLTGCRGAELGCSANPNGRTGRSPAVKVTLAQGQTVLVVVDGMANPDQDTPIRYTLHVSEYAETETGRCADGADNDADGFADAADSDCR